MSKKEEETGIQKPGSPRKDADCANKPCCGIQGCAWHEHINDD